MCPFVKSLYNEDMWDFIHWFFFFIHLYLLFEAGCDFCTMIHSQALLNEFSSSLTSPRQAQGRVAQCFTLQTKLGREFFPSSWCSLRLLFVRTMCRLNYRGREVYKGNSGRSQSHGFHLFRGAGNFRFASVHESGGGGGEIRLSRFCKGFFQGAGGLFCWHLVEDLFSIFLGEQSFGCLSL